MGLGAPVAVSPLIKFARYSFLGAGVLYGTYNQGRLEQVEAKARVIEAAKKEKRDVKLAAERKRSQEAEAQAIADLSKPTKK